MASYTDLPAEVRQLILLFALPDPGDYELPWDKDLQRLLVLNKQSFHDMKRVVQKWSPVYTLRKPHHCPLPPACLRSHLNLLPLPTTICLSLFNNAPINVHGEPAPSTGGPHLSLIPLLNRWQEALSIMLLDNVQTILIDATPAPRFIREQGPEQLAKFLDHELIRCYFFPTYVDYIAGTFTGLAHRHGRKMNFVLVGTYSEMSYPSINEIIDHMHFFNMRATAKVVLLEKPKESETITIWDATNKLDPNSFDLGPYYEDRKRACTTM